jgi:hypothetical protein
MKPYTKTLAPVAIILLFVTLGAPRLRAQITNPIQAQINHSFVVANEVLPPGHYTFRMEHDTNQNVMTVQNGKGAYVGQFSVRQSIDNRTPRHAELVFNKYGNLEFLTKVYENGNPDGVAVTETSKEEARLMQNGQRGLEHTEEQY